MSSNLKTNFVITGKLKNYTRAQMIDKIKAAGGVVQNNMNSTTNFLIVGDTGRHGDTNKILKAKESNIDIMFEDMFVNLTIEELSEFIQCLKSLNDIKTVYK